MTADILREIARRMVELVMTSEEKFSRDFIEVVQAKIHQLEMFACELDSARRKAQYEKSGKTDF